MIGSGCVQTPSKTNDLIEFSEDNIYFLNWGYFTDSKTICDACNNSYSCKLTPSFEFKIINLDLDLTKYGFACDVDVDNKDEGVETARIVADGRVLFVPTDKYNSSIFVRNSHNFDLCCFLYDLNANVDNAKTVDELYKPISDTVCKRYTIPESNCDWTYSS